MRSLIWLRSDLRVADNPALHAAARRADRGVVAVYAICPEQWEAHDTAPIKVDFILRNLRELSAALARRNIALRIVETPTFAGVPRALLAVAREHDCDALFFNREHEVNERRRDADVTATFENARVEVHAFTDQCLFEPGTLRTGAGTFYTVFTPFKRAWLRAFDADPDLGRVLPAPRKRSAMIGAPDAIPDAVAGFDPAAARPDLWPAGERTARARLAAFVRRRIESYHDRRDHPALSGTSGLSPYLASGVISARQCVAAAVDANEGRLDDGAPGAVAWLGELVWREFYKHVLVGFPRVCMHRAFKPATERIRWNDDDDHFRAWCAGRTGYPIVDAAMRQLAGTGWMHNRLRMIVAMFLSKNLFIDWRRGERFFMRHLVDGDLAANNGGWQWAASTGTDAVPYFRVFNPLAQSRRFDPRGVFIRRFLPELARLEAPAVHDPWSSPAAARLELDYPRPIVDHATTRRHAIEAFRAATAAPGALAVM
jgi:deoxyribodipyrimidine photo-lyase